MITLDRLVNVLGGYGVVSQLGSVPRSTELRSVVIPEEAGHVSGDVVLAIGARSVDDALQWAVAARAAVVASARRRTPVISDAAGASRC